MSWLAILALAVAGFAFAAFVLKLPRSSWTLFAAALLFGLAGYATQGAPDQPAAPKTAQALDPGSGEAMVEARKEFYDEGVLPSRYVVTADGFARRGQYRDAIDFLRNAVAENPNDSQAWVAMANENRLPVKPSTHPVSSLPLSRMAPMIPPHCSGLWMATQASAVMNFSGSPAELCLAVINTLSRTPPRTSDPGPFPLASFAPPRRWCFTPSWPTRWSTWWPPCWPVSSAVPGAGARQCWRCWPRWGWCWGYGCCWPAAGYWRGEDGYHRRAVSGSRCSWR